MALEVIKQINEELSALKEELKTMKGSTEELKTLSDKIADLERKKEFYEPKIDKDEVIKAEKKAADLVLKAKILGRPVDSFEEYKEVAGVVEKAIKPSDINNWLDERFSQSVIEKMELELKVEKLFGSITVPDGVNSLSLPQKTGTSTAYLIQPAEAAIESTITAGKVSFAPVKLKTLLSIADETKNEVVLNALLPLLQEDLAMSLARAGEDCVVNGDIAGSISGTTTPNSVTRAFDGLRKHGQANTVDNGGGAITLANILKAVASLGVYGTNPKDLVLIVNPAVYYQILGLSEVLTYDKFGSESTVRTGVVAKILGIDVVLSEYIPTNMNASGAVDESTPGTLTGALLVNVNGFKRAIRQAVEVENQRDISKDVVLYTARRYLDFKKVVIENNPISYIVNIAP